MNYFRVGLLHFSLLFLFIFFGSPPTTPSTSKGGKRGTPNEGNTILIRYLRRYQVACDVSLWATFGGQDVDRLPSASTCYNTLKVFQYRQEFCSNLSNLLRTQPRMNFWLNNNLIRLNFIDVSCLLNF